MKPGLTAIVITLNEEGDLARCLNSLTGLADEIVIVDSGSTDKTVEIARKFKAKVYERKFDNFANQRNFAIERASFEWILSLDADEVIPAVLAQEIKLTMKSPGFDGFLIPRKNIIFGAEIKHSRWSPDKHVWLFKKTAGKFTGEIHEEAIVEGVVGELKNAKLHYSYKNVASFLDMLNRYTSKEAEQAVGQGVKFSYVQLFYRPLLSFLRRFVYKLGFMDGWRGFVLVYLMAIYRLTTWVKIWEQENA